MFEYKVLFSLILCPWRKHPDETSIVKMNENVRRVRYYYFSSFYKWLSISTPCSLSLFYCSNYGLDSPEMETEPSLQQQCEPTLEKTEPEQTEPEPEKEVPGGQKPDSVESSTDQDELSDPIGKIPHFKEMILLYF